MTDPKDYVALQKICGKILAELDYTLTESLAQRVHELEELLKTLPQNEELHISISTTKEDIERIILTIASLQYAIPGMFPIREISH